MLTKTQVSSSELWCYVECLSADTLFFVETTCWDRCEFSDSWIIEKTEFYKTADVQDFDAK